MATGRDMQITKQVGEYLVAAELGRQGFITTTFTGNIPDFDILAINNEDDKIDSYGKDQFYIFKLKELQDIIFYKYNKHLESKKGIRPKNPKSTHVNVTPEDLVK